MATAIVQETQEHMQKAWRLLRRPCWPDTYEATMHDPIRAQLVHMYAHQLAQSRQLPIPPSAPRVPDRRNQPATPTLCRSSPTVVDRKRAAAGDRDD